MVKRISDQDLEDLLIKERGAFAVAFMSYSSIACDHFKPELAGLPEAMQGRIAFYAIDADENPTITGELGVEHTPTLVVFKDYEEVVRYEGPYSKEALKERLENAVFKKPEAPQ